MDAWHLRSSILLSPSSMSMNGYLALILTGHVPYLRSAGRDPEGEDALHETIAYSLVPTLNVLFDLRELGVRFTIALAYSPILLEQLGDIVVQKHFVVWMERWLARVSDDLVRWERRGEAHRSYLARFYLDWGQEIVHSFVGRYSRNLVAALRDLCADGSAEPLAGAATHAYLPLLGRAESLRAQLDIGTLNVTRLLGRRPRGLWLPECGYSPAIEQQIRSSGTRYTIVDPSSLAAGAEITHLRPRWVAARRLVVFVRDEQAGQQIWSPGLGYMGDPLYRSQQRDARSGLALWRGEGSAGAERLYDPYDAFRQAQEHAAHFSTYIAATLEAFHARHDRPGVALVPLDAALLGRAWFEGPTWLKALIESFVDHPAVALTAPAAYLRAYRPRQGVTLHDGSWGEGGDHRAWGGPAAVLWQAIGEFEERMAHLVRRFPNAQGDRERVLNQALRELLLAQSSDWPLMFNQGGAGDPLRRPAQHLHLCERLCAMAEAGDLSDADRQLLEEVEEQDNPFPHLNYRVFARS